MSLSARRRQLRSVLVPDALAKEGRRISGFLQSCKNTLPPSNDPVELEHRRGILNETANQLLSATLLTLREYEPIHYIAILDAVGRCARARLETGEGTLVVRRPRPGKEFGEWLLGAALVEAYKALRGRLDEVWKRPAVIASVRSPRFVSRKKRYGADQYLGFQRRVARERARADELCRAIQELSAQASDLVERKFDERTARRLVRRHQTPGRVSLAALAHLLDRTPRATKALLSRARKRLRKAERVHAVLDLWGYGRAGQPSAPSPSESVKSLRERRAHRPSRWQPATGCSLTTFVR